MMPYVISGAILGLCIPLVVLSVTGRDAMFQRHGALILSIWPTSLGLVHSHHTPLWAAVLVTVVWNVLLYVALGMALWTLFGSLSISQRAPRMRNSSSHLKRFLVLVVIVVGLAAALALVTSPPLTKVAMLVSVAVGIFRLAITRPSFPFTSFLMRRLDPGYGAATQFNELRLRDEMPRASALIAATWAAVAIWITVALWQQPIVSLFEMPVPWPTAAVWTAASCVYALGATIVAVWLVSHSFARRERDGR